MAEGTKAEGGSTPVRAGNRGYVTGIGPGLVTAVCAGLSSCMANNTIYGTGAQVLPADSVVLGIGGGIQYVSAEGNPYDPEDQPLWAPYPITMVHIGLGHDFDCVFGSSILSSFIFARVRRQVFTRVMRPYALTLECGGDVGGFGDGWRSLFAGLAVSRACERCEPYGAVRYHSGSYLESDPERAYSFTQMMVFLGMKLEVSLLKHVAVEAFVSVPGRPDGDISMRGGGFSITGLSTLHT